MNTSLRFLLLPALLWAAAFRPMLAQTQADPVLVGTTSEGADGFGAIFQFTPPCQRHGYANGAKIARQPRC